MAFPIGDEDSPGVPCAGAIFVGSDVGLIRNGQTNGDFASISALIGGGYVRHTAMHEIYFGNEAPIFFLTSSILSGSAGNTKRAAGIES